MTTASQLGGSFDRGTASEAVRDYTLPESETTALALKVGLARDLVGLLHGDTATCIAKFGNGT